MKTAKLLIKRNVKLFFKDKGLFFTSLITPFILLVLYATFLKNVYTDSFMQFIPNGLISENLIESLVGGQLISSILAVSCVTVAFCSNFLMVQDRANGSIKDIRMSPVSSSTLALGYYVASLFATLTICLTSAALCLGYIALVGWYLTVTDVLLIILDVFLLSFFGTAISSIINFFLSTQGQISAVGSIISSSYGFLCGAYMPISSFGDGLQKAVMFLPGTYGTGLLRNHATRAVFAEMEKEGLPSGVITQLKDSIDANLYFFGNEVSSLSMYLVLSGTVIILVAVYVLMNALKKKEK